MHIYIYILDVYMHRIQRKRDLTTKSLITFGKIYLAVQRPCYYQEALKQKRNKKGTLRSNIRSCTTLCRFVFLNPIMLKLSFIKPETGIPLHPISFIAYKKEYAKKKNPRLLYFNLFLDHFKTVILIKEM